MRGGGGAGGVGSFDHAGDFAQTTDTTVVECIELIRTAWVTTMLWWIKSITLSFTHRWGIAVTNEPRHVKTNKMSVRLAKSQISLGIRPV